MKRMTLSKYLATHPHRGFSRTPHFYRDGPCLPAGRNYLTYFLSEERCHSVCVNEFLTMYLSLDGIFLVGFKVYCGA